MTKPARGWPVEAIILESAQEVFANDHIRQKDIVRWAASPIEPADGQVVAYLDDFEVYVIVNKENDCRQ